jgi:hypothetical protein
MNSKATTTPDTHQELLPSPFSAAIHAMINTLDHKFHISHHFSMLQGSISFVTIDGSILAKR